ncbi:class I histocompatibility antigen, F10 alpha chain-like isoform X1 [Carcharodon carcharias]|uniref:class I histocompatibility antigen, F10 alpha chain-like isoform X1 n=2 Tax=Carcharodon carcharias TaxID=13397 RepID=UPI001B7F2C41|nr:class I histocompatibility antigen, F10 alpha chain-like isoform X1 [Carcharodon carcharias]XP_041069654.1 class I histocompatibility antigen, F10 alpha chain-like isoform X1 [Carcharodon carcharias]
MLLILFSISLYFSWVSPDSNAFTVMYLATSGTNDLPEYLGVGMINGVSVAYYDSGTHQIVSRQQWMADSFDAEYWEYLTNRGNKHCAIAKENLKMIMKNTNQTSGIHIFQWIRTVEVAEGGSIKRSMRFGFDGKDYISLESDRMRWVASNHIAVKTMEKWNSDEAWNKYWKWQLEVELAERLKLRLHFGKEYLKRKVQPEVFISRSDPSSQYKPLTLSCLVTGFYPVDIKVSWLRNREIMSETLSSGVRPNHDGTHQIQKEIEINAGDEDQYSCQIEHSSLAETQLSQWEILENSWGHLYPGFITGLVIAALAIIFGIIGKIIWKMSWRETDKTGIPQQPFHMNPGKGHQIVSAQPFLKINLAHHHPETMDNNMELKLTESYIPLTTESFQRESQSGAHVEGN